MGYTHHVNMVIRDSDKPTLEKCNVNFNRLIFCFVTLFYVLEQPRSLKLETHEVNVNFIYRYERLLYKFIKIMNFFSSFHD